MAQGINVLAAYIQGGAEAVKKALGSLASSLIQQLIPGPIGGALGNLVNAIFNRQKGKKLETEVTNVVRTAPANVSMLYGMNSASAVMGGRGMQTGAAFVVIDLKEDADKLFTASVTRELGNLNVQEGYA